MQNFRALGQSPQTPKIGPHCEFLATRLVLAWRGTIFVWGGTSSYLGGHSPGMPPGGAGPAMTFRRGRLVLGCLYAADYAPRLL